MILIRYESCLKQLLNIDLMTNLGLMTDLSHKIVLWNCLLDFKTHRGGDVPFSGFGQSKKYKFMSYN